MVMPRDVVSRPRITIVVVGGHGRYLIPITPIGLLSETRIHLVYFFDRTMGYSTTLVFFVCPFRLAWHSPILLIHPKLSNRKHARVILSRSSPSFQLAGLFVAFFFFLAPLPNESDLLMVVTSVHLE